MADDEICNLKGEFMDDEIKNYVLGYELMAHWSSDVKKQLLMMAKPSDKSMWFVFKNHITGFEIQFEELKEALDYFDVH